MVLLDEFQLFNLLQLALCDHLEVRCQLTVSKLGLNGVLIQIEWNS